MVLSLEMLRIFAVVAVLIFHANPYWLPNGYLGVDVFFVISGYLMMSLSLRQEKKFSILEFIWRRWARLFPMLLITVAVSLCFVLFTAPPFYFVDYQQSANAALLFFSNISFWKGSGYFNLEQKLDPLLHTWSLSVEFQFYILFALAFVVVVRFSGLMRKLFVTAIFCFSAYLYATMIGDHPSAVFYLLPTRAWEFVAGSFVALLVFHHPNLTKAISNPKNLSSEFVQFGCYLVFFVGVLAALKSPLPGLHLNFMVVAATTVLILVTQHVLIDDGKASHRAIGFLGGLTYPLYLTHYPVFLFFKENSVETAYIGMFVAAVTFALALLKLDDPIRSFLYSSHWKQRAGVLTTTLLASASLFLASDQIRNLNVQLFRTNANVSKVIMNDLYTIEVDKRSNVVEKFQTLETGCWSVHRGVSGKFKDEFSRCLADHGPPIIIFGDSHSEGLFFLLQSNTAFRDSNPFVMGIFSGGCRLNELDGCFFKDLAEFNNANAGDIDSLFYHQAGFYLMKSGIYNGGRTLFTVDNPEILSGIELDVAAIERTIENLKTIGGSSKKVTWVGPWMDPFISRRLAIGSGCEERYEYPPHSVRAYDALDRKLNEVLGVQFLSLNAMLELDLSVDFGNCDEIYWSDTDHMTLSGFKRFSERLKFEKE